MERNTNTRAYENDQQTVLSIQAGGTNANNIPDAITNLGAINKNRLGVSNGVASLDNNVKILPEQLPYVPGNEMPSLFGPASVYTHSVTSYEITNFDSQVSYLIEANHGMINYAPGNSSFQYEAPATPGTDVISINGKNVGISILTSSMIRPVIISPLDDESGVSFRPTFSVGDPAFIGFEDTIIAVHWNLATDAGFTTNLQTFDVTTGNLSILALGQALALSQNYFLRVRFESASLGLSEWSLPISFTTTAITFPTTEVAILHRPDIGTDPTGGGSFGSQIALSADNTIMMTVDTSSVKAFIYKRVNDTWEYQATINEPISAPVSDFGKDILIASDNQTFFISDSEADTYGNVYVYKTTVANDYSTLTLIQTIHAGVTQLFGECIRLSANDQVLFVSSADWTDVTINRIYVYRWDDQRWDNPGYFLSEEIVNPSPATDGADSFATSDETFAINALGNRIAISACQASPSFAGLIYVYDYDGDVWNLSATLEPDQNTVAEFFGWPVGMSPDGNTIVCGNYFDQAPFPCKIYFFELVNSSWVKQSYTHPEWTEQAPDGLGGQVSTIRFTADGSSIFIAAETQTALTSELSEWGPWNGDGAVHLFQKETGNWVEKFKYIASNYARNAYFGAGLAINSIGTELLVGAPSSFWSTSNTENGGLYIFR